VHSRRLVKRRVLVILSETRRGEQRRGEEQEQKRRKRERERERERERGRAIHAHKRTYRHRTTVDANNERGTPVFSGQHSVRNPRKENRRNGGEETRRNEEAAGKNADEKRGGGEGGRAGGRVRPEEGPGPPNEFKYLNYKSCAHGLIHGGAALEETGS